MGKKEAYHYHSIAHLKFSREEKGSEKLDRMREQTKSVTGQKVLILFHRHKCHRILHRKALKAKARH